MPFQIFAFPAPLGRSFAVDHADNSPKPVPAPQDISNSLPATVDNPLAWLPPHVITALRQLTTLCPNATALTLQHQCRDSDVATLTFLLLEARLDLPPCDDLAELLGEMDTLLEQGLRNLGLEATGEARRALILNRLLPVLATLEPLAPLVEAAESILDADQDGTAIEYLQGLLQRHAAEDVAAPLTRFCNRRTQRNLQRSVERAVQRHDAVSDAPGWEQASTFYEALLDAAQADGSPGAIGALRPAGWLGGMSLATYIEALCGSLLASALAGIINPGR